MPLGSDDNADGKKKTQKFATDRAWKLKALLVTTLFFQVFFLYFVRHEKYAITAPLYSKSLNSRRHLEYKTQLQHSDAYLTQEIQKQELTGYNGNYRARRENPLSKTCVGITTKERADALGNEQHYLKILSTTLIESLDDGERSTIEVRVFPAFDSENTKDAELVGRLDGFRFMPRDKKTPHGFVDIDDRQPSLVSAWERSLTLDMAHAIESTWKCADAANSSYIVVLEDDLVVTSHFVHKLQMGLKEISEPHDDWLFVKLFIPDNYSGWNVRKHWHILAGLSVAAALLSVVSAPVWLDGVSINVACSPKNIHFLLRKNPETAVGICVYFVYLVLFTAIVPGKQWWHFTRPHGLERIQLENIPYTGCAHVYNALFARDVADYLRSESRHAPYDVLLTRFQEMHDMHVYHLVPDLVQHIGVWSSSAVGGHHGAGGDYTKLVESPTFVL